MWTLVDAGLGTYIEISEHWPIERYFEALSYLAAKQAAEQKALAQAKAGQLQ